MSTPPPSSSDPARSGALAELTRAADPALQTYADDRHPPAGRFESRFPPGSVRAFVVEAIHEGWLMHYGTPRAFSGMDEDLRLLGGDSLYALGLARLADAGDLDGVAELADLISSCARAAAEGRSDAAEELWSATVIALAHQE